MTRKKLFDWKAVAVIIGLLAGAGAFGLVMPWNAASKEEVAAKFEENDDEHTKIQRELGTIQGKLDIIIEEVTK